MEIICYPSPIGNLKIVLEDKQLVAIEFLHKKTVKNSAKITALGKKVIRQLDEYFAGKRKIFDLPLKLEGTAFQIKVWKALEKVPYGITASYKDIAVKIGKPLAARAVGMANNRNKLPIVIPCHRIIGNNGALVGYAGGLKIKEFLLQLEKI